MKKLKKVKIIAIILGSIIGIYSSLVTGTLAIMNYINTQNAAEQKEIQRLLDLAAYYYEVGEYTALGQIYSDSRLQNNPQVLLNTGVMYANGIYLIKIRRWQNTILERLWKPVNLSTPCYTSCNC